MNWKCIAPSLCPIGDRASSTLARRRPTRRLHTVRLSEGEAHMKIPQITSLRPARRLLFLLIVACVVAGVAVAVSSSSIVGRHASAGRDGDADHGEDSDQGEEG